MCREETALKLNVLFVHPRSKHAKCNQYSRLLIAFLSLNFRQQSTPVFPGALLQKLYALRKAYMFNVPKKDERLARHSHP